MVAVDVDVVFNKQNPVRGMGYANEHANELGSGGTPGVLIYSLCLDLICISIFDQVVRHYAFIWTETIKA